MLSVQVKIDDAVKSVQDLGSSVCGKVVHILYVDHLNVLQRLDDVFRCKVLRTSLQGLPIIIQLCLEKPED